MLVHVRYFAVLRERRKVEAEIVEVGEGTTAEALYATLFPAPRLPIGFAVNLEHVSGSTLLSDGDELALLPPLGGG